MAARPGQYGLVDRLASIERRITETQRAIPAASGVHAGAWRAPETSPGLHVPPQVDTPVTHITDPVREPRGCSYANGVFTATYSGWWLLTLTIQWQRGPGSRWATLSSATGTRRWGGLGGITADYMTATAVAPLEHHEQVRALVASDVPSALFTADGGNLFTAVRLGPL